MKTWVTPIARALDERRTPLEIFLRDDDGGWEDERLATLLDLCATFAWPIDVALIPTALSSSLTEAISRRLARGALIGLHQHGFTHRNHELDGRPCEFGPSRSAAEQGADLAEGRHLLHWRFGAALDPVFTPPWNRCTAVTTRCLADIGVLAISRDRTGDAVACNGLIPIPIDVDWFSRVKGIRRSSTDWAGYLAAAIAAAGAPIGIMLHHAQMSADDFAALADVLELFAVSGRVRGLRMRDIVGAHHPSAERHP